MTLDHFIEVGKPVQRLRGPKNQIAPGVQRPMQPGKDVLFQIRRKIDQHISAHDNVEFAEHVSVQQVQFLEFHHGLDLRANLPPTVSRGDRKSTRLNSSHVKISYADFCLKKKK